jgi:hypothetical protein
MACSTANCLAMYCHSLEWHGHIVHLVFQQARCTNARPHAHTRLRASSSCISCPLRLHPLRMQSRRKTWHGGCHTVCSLIAFTARTQHRLHPLLVMCTTRLPPQHKLFHTSSTVHGQGLLWPLANGISCHACQHPNARHTEAAKEPTGTGNIWQCCGAFRCIQSTHNLLHTTSMQRLAAPNQWQMGKSDTTTDRFSFTRHVD